MHAIIILTITIAMSATAPGPRVGDSWSAFREDCRLSRSGLGFWKDQGHPAFPELKAECERREKLLLAERRRQAS